MTLSEETFESREGLPRLIDIINFAREGDNDERMYFSRFGFEQLEIPDDCTHIKERFAILTERFNERYMFRRIAQETMPRWQVRMQNRMDTIAHRYERAYTLYGLYADELESGALEGETETTEGQRSKLSGKDTSTAEGTSDTNDTTTDRMIDTPDSRVNEDDDYADAYQKSENSGASTRTEEREVTYGRTDDVSLERTKRKTGRGMIAGLNDNIMSWMDIDIMLVGEFENMFLNTFE